MTKKFDNFSILLKQIMDDEDDNWSDESLDKDILCEKTNDIDSDEQMNRQIEKEFPNEEPVEIIYGPNSFFKNKEQNNVLEEKYFTQDELTNLKIDKKDVSDKIINPNKKRRKIKPCKNFDE